MRAHAAAKTSIGRGVIASVLGVGLAAGFGIGLLVSVVDEDAPATFAVDADVRLGARATGSATLERGWAKPGEAWGSWMSLGQASLLLGFDGPAAGDVVMGIEARAGPHDGHAPGLLIIRFNDAEIGRWQLPSEARPLRRSFVIPSEVFNRTTVARVSFEDAGGSAAPRSLGLERLWLRDARKVIDVNGFIDRCSPGLLQGWAVADDAPVSVIAKVNGAPIRATFMNVDRPDLLNHGLPLDAGFAIKPLTPLPLGSYVDVVLPNGRALRRSPCRVQ